MHGFGLDSGDQRPGLCRPLFIGTASGKYVRRDGKEEQGTDSLSEHGHFVLWAGEDVVKQHWPMLGIGGLSTMRP